MSICVQKHTRSVNAKVATMQSNISNHHYECVTLYKAISLLKYRLWAAASLAASSPVSKMDDTHSTCTELYGHLLHTQLITEELAVLGGRQTHTVGVERLVTTVPGGRLQTHHNHCDFHCLMLLPATFHEPAQLWAIDPSLLLVHVCGSTTLSP